MQHFFITGIGTGVGKTLISSILCEAWKADYWKPIQAGDSPKTDSNYVESLISNPITVIHPETYLLKQPLSPHAAAELQQLQINPDNINLPATKNILVIEGAGGIMVPLTNSFLILDLIKKLNSSVIVVATNYLGSINHTLLTIETLKSHKVSIAGIIFNGLTVPSSESYILNYTQLKCIGRISQQSTITKAVIAKQGIQFKNLVQNKLSGL